MFTWTLGPCRRRSRALEEIDKPDTPEEDLARVFDFLGFLNGGLGGHRVVLNFLREASKNWPTHRPVSILELRCGRGDLSAALVRWARKKNIDLRILAVDDCPGVISLAREHHGMAKEIAFEVRLLSDPYFLEAQRFDYVVSSSILHSVDAETAVKILKKANMLAKRGIIFCDWLRDVRAWMWMQALSRFWGDDIVVHDALLSVCKGYTVAELDRMAIEAGLDYFLVKKHLGYRFSIAGERGLVMSPLATPVAGLAGA